MERDGVASADVRPGRAEGVQREGPAAPRGTVWNAGGCASYYLDRNGRNSTIYPGSKRIRRRSSSVEPG